MPRRKAPVVIYGGYGVFGRLVAEDLLQHTGARLIIVGRDRRKAETYASTLGGRATAAVSDIDDFGSVKAVVADAAGVICCAGPFQSLSLNVLRAAMDCRVPYADIADSRAYIRQVYGLEEDIHQANIPVLTGLSTVPGTASILVKLASEAISQIDAVHIALFMGNKNAKGEGAIRSLLGGLGNSIVIPKDGAVVSVRVWEGRQIVEFPSPIGRRPVYWFDAPDYDLLPRYFKAKTVTFKCGFDLDLINHSLAVLRICKRLTSYPVECLASALIALSKTIAFLGAGQGMLRVEVLGRIEGRSARWLGTIHANVRGQRVAAVPAAVAGAAFWNGEIRTSGILPMYEWIEPREYLKHLERRGFHCMVPVQ